MNLKCASFYLISITWSSAKSLCYNCCMHKHSLYIFLFLLFLSGCTQIITAPIEIVGSVASATIDVTASAVDAVIPDSDDKTKD